MYSYIVRWLERLTVFIVGSVGVYLAVWKIFPFFDNRTPIALALFFTYAVAAYLVLPALLRIFRLFVRPAHIPLYCVTPDGFASDPINIGIIGTRKQLIKAMQSAGWYMADKRTLRTIIKLLYAMAFGQPYPHAPFSPLYLFGRRPDIGFQKPAGESGSHRHHVRFWACNLDGPEQFHKDVHFWQRFHAPQTTASPGRQLWVGAASKDIGVRFIRHNAQFTHMVDPDTNAERDLIVHNLRKTRTVLSTSSITTTPPFELRNRVFRGFLRADGRLSICELKDN